MSKEINAMGLNSQQLEVITHLIVGCTQREAAERAGVDEATVSRWKNHDPAFRAAYTLRRREVWESHSRKLRTLAGEALDVLSEAMQSDDESRRIEIAKFVFNAIDAADLLAIEAKPANNPLSDIMADW